MPSFCLMSSLQRMRVEQHRQHFCTVFAGFPLCSVPAATTSCSAYVPLEFLPFPTAVLTGLLDPLGSTQSHRHNRLFFFFSDGLHCQISKSVMWAELLPGLWERRKIKKANKWQNEDRLRTVMLLGVRGTCLIFIGVVWPTCMEKMTTISLQSVCIKVCTYIFLTELCGWVYCILCRPVLLNLWRKSTCGVFCWLDPLALPFVNFLCVLTSSGDFR